MKCVFTLFNQSGNRDLTSKDWHNGPHLNPKNKQIKTVQDIQLTCKTIQVANFGGMIHEDLKFCVHLNSNKSRLYQITFPKLVKFCAYE